MRRLYLGRCPALARAGLLKLPTLAAHLHPAEAADEVARWAASKRSMLCFSPYVLDHVPEQALGDVYVVALDGDRGAEMPITAHPEWSRWRETMRAGEFWAAFGERWALGLDEPATSAPPGLRAQFAAMLAEADEPEALLEAVRGIIADRQHAIAQVGRLYADRNALACALAQAIQLAGGVAGVMTDPHAEARFARAVVIHLPGAGRVGWHLDALDPAPAARLAAFPGAWETWPPEENRARLERFLASPPTPIPSRLLGWASDVEDTAASPAATLEGVAATLRRDLAPEPETVVAEVEAGGATIDLLRRGRLVLWRLRGVVEGSGGAPVELARGLVPLSRDEAEAEARAWLSGPGRAQHVVEGASPSAGVAAEAPAGEAETAAPTAPRAATQIDWTHEVGVGEGEVR